MHPDKSGRGWTLVERTPTILRYEKTLAAQRGSALVALILLLFFVVPGILYMIYARKPARTLRLTVTTSPHGTLTPSGDGEAVAKFRQFLDPKKATTQTLRRAVIGIIVFVLVIVWTTSVVKNNPPTPTTSTTPSTDTTTTPTQPAGKVEVKSSSVKSDSTVTSIVGEVVNNTTKPVADIRITATLYDAAGAVVDTNSRTVAWSVYDEPPLQPADTTPFDIGFIEPKPFTDYKLSVTWR